MFGMSWFEMMFIGVIAILLFGKRLPEVARSLGNSYREFKRSLTEFHAHVDVMDTTYTNNPAPSSRSRSSSGPSYRDADDYDEATAPRFEPPPSEPTVGKDDVPPSGKIDKPISEK